MVGAGDASSPSTTACTAWSPVYTHAMNTQLIAVICAIIAVVLTPIYLILGVKGLKTLSQIRDATKQRS